MTIRARTAEEDDRLAAAHEAGHAVFAVGADDEWIQLAGPVELRGRGRGAAWIQLNREKLLALDGAGVDFDTIAPRQALISAFVAGAVAEAYAARLWNIPLDPDETALAASGDYVLARQALAKLQHEDPGATLEDFEAAAKASLDTPIWRVIEAFADLLRDRRAIPAQEAVAIIHRLGAQLAA